MLLSREAAIYAADHLTADDFFRAAHQTIFDACQTLTERRVALDYVTVDAHLKTIGVLDEVGGPAYVAGLTDGVPRSTNVAHYVEVVRDHRVRRECLGLADKIASAVAQGELTGGALVETVDGWLLDLDRGPGGDAMVGQGPAVANALAALDWRMAHRGELTGITTGFVGIDEWTQGWQAGDFVILAARPSVGKSALMLNMAVAAARTGKGVAIFSLEMTVEQVEFRLFSAMSGVPMENILHGALTEFQQQQVGAAAAELCALPIYLDDTAGISAPQIRAKCRRVQIEHGLDLIMVDYLQLCGGSTGRGDSTRQEEVADISRRLKATGKDLGVPMVALSQLSRPKDDSGKPPRLTDLRESGALEQDADVVAFIHRHDHKVDGAATFILEKQRNGQPATVELFFDGSIVRFSSAKA